jgi:uncharacterized protein GlcG (DUF336 family)
MQELYEQMNSFKLFGGITVSGAKPMQDKEIAEKAIW